MDLIQDTLPGVPSEPAKPQQRVLLFLGGPAHGKEMVVKDGVDQLRIPIPPDMRARDASGLPILSADNEVIYLRRRFGDPRQGAGREAMVAVEVAANPQMALSALADVLVQRWVRVAA